MYVHSILSYQGHVNFSAIYSENMARLLQTEDSDDLIINKTFHTSKFFKVYSFEASKLWTDQ